MHRLGAVTSQASRGPDFFPKFWLWAVLSRSTATRGLFLSTLFVSPLYCESKMGSFVFVPLTVFEKIEIIWWKVKNSGSRLFGTPCSKFQKFFFNLLINSFCDDFCQKIPSHEVLSVLHKEMHASSKRRSDYTYI